MNIPSLFPILLAGAMLNQASAQDSSPLTTRYRIHCEKPGVAKVSIEHVLASKQLFIDHRTTKEGKTTSDFIVNARITLDGESHALESGGRGVWLVESAGVGERVLIEYDLLLEHGKYTWPHGREEIGFELGDGAFLVGRNVLLADNSAAQRPVEISFGAVDSHGPWQSLGKNRWLAADLDAVRTNCFVFGDGFGRFIAETDQGNVTFLHDKASTGLAKQAAADIAPALAHTTAIFGDFPVSNYCIFLFENDHPEGGAYNDSFSMLHPTPAQPVDAGIWRQGFIHEINHLWVGHQIRQADGADIEWFKEGVADYLAIKTMWKLGYLNQQALEDKLEGLMRRHTLGVFMSEGKIAMTSAGANKSQNLMIIYGSGATWAFMLDVEMAAHEGPGSFEAMLKDLYDHSEEAYTLETLMERINVSSNGAAGRLLEQFDRNLMPMAFPGMLEPYGMEVAFMIPDMFELDLTPEHADGKQHLPAFLQASR